MSTKSTTTVDLVLRLQVEGSPTDVATYRAALECLADVMRVQAEDGLWSLGQPEAESESGPSTHVADIESAHVLDVLIDPSPSALHARSAHLAAIAEELAIIASHAAHVPGETTAMDVRIESLVRQIDDCTSSSRTFSRTAWQLASNHFKARADERADEGTSIHLAYLVLAEYCAHMATDANGGPTLEMALLAENTVGENLDDVVGMKETCA